MAERQSDCHRYDGRPKRRVESPSHAIRAIEWAAEAGKRTAPYRCPVCGYVHMGSQPGWNTPEKRAMRLIDRWAAQGR